MKRLVLLLLLQYCFINFCIYLKALSLCACAGRAVEQEREQDVFFVGRYYFRNNQSVSRSSNWLMSRI